MTQVPRAIPPRAGWRAEQPLSHRIKELRTQRSPDVGRGKQDVEDRLRASGAREHLTPALRGVPALKRGTSLCGFGEPPTLSQGAQDKFKFSPCAREEVRGPRQCRAQVNAPRSGADGDGCSAGPPQGTGSSAGGPLLDGGEANIEQRLVRGPPPPLYRVGVSAPASPGEARDSAGLHRLHVLHDLLLDLGHLLGGAELEVLGPGVGSSCLMGDGCGNPDGSRG